MNLKGQTVLVYDKTIDAWYLVRVTEEANAFIKGGYIAIDRKNAGEWHDCLSMEGLWYKENITIVPVAAPPVKKDAPFRVGERVTHKLTMQDVLILPEEYPNANSDLIPCRTQDLTIRWLYPDELERPY